MPTLGSSAEGLQIKGKSQEMNLTIEGVGRDATIHGFGMLIRNSKSGKRIFRRKWPVYTTCICFSGVVTMNCLISIGGNLNNSFSNNSLSNNR